MKIFKNLIFLLIITILTMNSTQATIKRIEHIFNFTPVIINNSQLLSLGGWDDIAQKIVPPYLYNINTDEYILLNTKMNFKRKSYSTFKIDSNNILILGGTDNSGKYIHTAEIYNIKKHTFNKVGNTNFIHLQPSIIKLDNGNVFILSFSKAEIYNPITKQFYMVDKLKKDVIDSPNGKHIFYYNTLYKYSSNEAVKLNDGTVLIIGNQNGKQRAELYNYTDNKFETTSFPLYLRNKPSINSLQDGKILITGGFGQEDCKSAELYDPVTKQFKRTGNLVLGRYYHNTITLANGNVLVVGGLYGQDEKIKYRRAIELYNPKTEKFKIIGFTINRPMLTKLELIDRNRVVISGNGMVDIFKY